MLPLFLELVLFLCWWY